MAVDIRDRGKACIDIVLTRIRGQAGGGRFHGRISGGDRAIGDGHGVEGGSHALVTHRAGGALAPAPVIIDCCRLRCREVGAAALALAGLLIIHSQIAKTYLITVKHRPVDADLLRVAPPDLHDLGLDIDLLTRNIDLVEHLADLLHPRCGGAHDHHVAGGVGDDAPLLAYHDVHFIVVFGLLPGGGLGSGPSASPSMLESISAASLALR